MNFNLTEEQEALVNKTRDLMRNEIRPYIDKLNTEEGIPKDVVKHLLKQTIPLGIMGNLIPKAYGGSGMDHITWGLVYEQLDRAINSVIMITTSAALSIAITGSDEHREKYLKPLINADMIGCSAITEPNVGSNPSMIETTAELKGDHYVLNGEKVWITNGAMADIVIVLATVDPSLKDKGLIRLLVDKKESPFESRSIPTIADKGHLGELKFTNCLVPKENLMVSKGGGLKETMKAFQRARCFVALTGVHLMQQSIDTCIAYAAEKPAIGNPLAKSQLIQQMIAEMIAQTNAARLLTLKALGWIDNGVQKNAASSTAKYYATEAAVEVTSKAVQIHGHLGLTKGSPVEEYYRLARMLTIPDGATQIQKLIVGREVTGISAFN